MDEQATNHQGTLYSPARPDRLSRGSLQPGRSMASIALPARNVWRRSCGADILLSAMMSANCYGLVTGTGSPALAIMPENGLRSQTNKKSFAVRKPVKFASVT